MSDTFYYKKIILYQLHCQVSYYAYRARARPTAAELLR